MEVSEKDIETLREAVDGCGGSSYTQALAILDRLSPAPEPEVDEATVWTRRLFLLEYPGEEKAINNGDRDGNPYFKRVAECLRQAIAELIASKDGEIGRLRNVAKVNCDIANDCASELATLRAENERSIKLTPAEIQSGLDRVRWAELLIKQLPENHDGRNSWLLNFAAERNPAEPATDTTPEVDASVDSGMGAEAVGQAELFWAQLPTNRKWASILTHEKALVCHLLSTYRIEAEARGRRQALERISEDTKQWVSRERENARKLFKPSAEAGNGHLHFAAHAAFKALDELKRMMTGEK